ncbi:hypothetical protein KC19_10G025300 [Ceratodon purpureus]|uniref:Secreted protein n=1 Tax=Ceratodon purpureus TaxID=3225 RepID=A0A8T0GKZ3_CERPU|nr:hypothetical protein KC19_10G025300 [Ceratodon purpureus]
MWSSNVGLLGFFHCARCSLAALRNRGSNASFCFSGCMDAVSRCGIVGFTECRGWGVHSVPVRLGFSKIKISRGRFSRTERVMLPFDYWIDYVRSDCLSISAASFVTMVSYGGFFEIGTFSVFQGYCSC